MTRLLVVSSGVTGTIVGGDLTGTLPDPTIAAGAVTAAKVAAALKPSGTAATTDEALRALGTSANTAAAGNDTRLVHVTPWDPNWVWAGGTPLFGWANNAPGVGNRLFYVRCVAHVAGTISDFDLGTGATSAGNVDVGVYTYSAGTYTAAWRKGSTACPAASSHTSMGNPNVSVTLGQVFYLTLQTDSTTASFQRSGAATVAGYNQLIAGRIAGFCDPGSFPLPTSFTDAGSSVHSAFYSMGVKIT